MTEKIDELLKKMKKDVESGDFEKRVKMRGEQSRLERKANMIEQQKLLKKRRTPSIFKRISNGIESLFNAFLDLSEVETFVVTSATSEPTVESIDKVYNTPVEAFNDVVFKISSISPTALGLTVINAIFSEDKAIVLTKNISLTNIYNLELSNDRKIH